MYSVTHSLGLLSDNMENHHIILIYKSVQLSTLQHNTIYYTCSIITINSITMIITISLYCIPLVSGPQPVGRGPVPVRRPIGTGPRKKYSLEI